MEIKFKKLTEKAVAPSRAYTTDAGFDLTCAAVTTVRNECGQVLLVYHSGIAVEIPEGYVGMLFPRSSVYKKSLMQSNCVGIIDAGYRGEVIAVMRNTTDVVPAIYKEGDRFAQLVIVKLPEIDSFVESDELSETERNVGGFGSTDPQSENENTNSNESQTENMDSADKATDHETEASDSAVAESHE